LVGKQGIFGHQNMLRRACLVAAQGMFGLASLAAKNIPRRACLVAAHGMFGWHVWLASLGMFGHRHVWLASLDAARHVLVSQCAFGWPVWPAPACFFGGPDSCGCLRLLVIASRMAFARSRMASREERGQHRVGRMASLGVLEHRSMEDGICKVKDGIA